MGWPYHFVDLTHDDVLARRHALDKYGFIAQISAILVILGVTTYQWTFNRTAKARRGPLYSRVPTSAPSPGPTTELDGGADDAVELRSSANSETAADEHKVTTGSGEEISAPVGRLSSWLDKPIVPGWKETRRQALSMSLWSAWAISLALRQTGQDYLHATKRFAQIAAALLPFHYLLGTSSRLSPLPLLFRTSPSSLYNPYHRMQALLILFLLASHVTWYLNFYYWASKLPGRLFDLDVLLGLAMATSICTMALLARQSIRYDPKRRTWFTQSHLAAAGVIPCLLYFHAPPARWYAAEMLFVYLGVLFERLMRKRRGVSG